MSSQTEQAIQAFINASTWAEKKRIVEKQDDLLLTEMAEWVFATLLKQYKCRDDAKTIRILEEHEAVLDRCRHEGIAAAFADYLDQDQSRPAQASSVQDYPPGIRIGGHFEVVDRPMKGGMGLVFICYDHETSRPVVLKTFKPELLPDRSARDRFLREGKAWVDLGRHPHIVRCYDIIYSDPEVYLVLELVAKEQGYNEASLRSWLIPGHPLPVEQALLFALQIARGMKHAVETIPGFVHRDLKPENILVGADRLSYNGLSETGVNRLRVTDFGLASVLQVAGEHMGIERDMAKDIGRTHLTRGIVGTPIYMAPEQWRGDRVTERTDIYALGCILYEMMTGQRAATGNSPVALSRSHCAGNLRPPPSDMSKHIRVLLGRCLALEPGDRYGSWVEVEDALEATFYSVTGRTAPTVESAADISRSERVQAGWAYSELGASYLGMGRADIAKRYFEQALETGKVEEMRSLEALALNRLGEASRTLGDIQRAIGYYEQSIGIVREIRNRHVEGAALGNLGAAYATLGDNRRAISYYELALEIDTEIGDRRSEGLVLNNLGIAYKNLGDFRSAISYYEQSLVIKREVGKSTAVRGILWGIWERHTAFWAILAALSPFTNSRWRLHARLVTGMGKVKPWVTWGIYAPRLAISAAPSGTANNLLPFNAR